MKPTTVTIPITLDLAQWAAIWQDVTANISQPKTADPKDYAALLAKISPHCVIESVLATRAESALKRIDPDSARTAQREAGFMAALRESERANPERSRSTLRLSLPGRDEAQKI